MFNKDDKVKVIAENNYFVGYTGTVVKEEESDFETDNGKEITEVTVKLDVDLEDENKDVLETFYSDELELVAANESLNEDMSDLRRFNDYPIYQDWFDALKNEISDLNDEEAFKHLKELFNAYDLTIENIFYLLRKYNTLDDAVDDGTGLALGSLVHGLKKGYFYFHKDKLLKPFDSFNYNYIEQLNENLDLHTEIFNLFGGKKTDEEVDDYIKNIKNTHNFNSDEECLKYIEKLYNESFDEDDDFIDFDKLYQDILKNEHFNEMQVNDIKVLYHESPDETKEWIEEMIHMYPDYFSSVEEIIADPQNDEAAGYFFIDGNRAEYVLDNLYVDGEQITESLKEDLNVKKSLLKEAKENIEDLIHKYIYLEDLDGKEIPAWNFASRIATAENLEEGHVEELAKELGYKLILVEAPNIWKVIIAAKEVKLDDIKEEYADFLLGNAVIRELK